MEYKCTERKYNGSPIFIGKDNKDYVFDDKQNKFVMVGNGNVECVNNEIKDKLTALGLL